MSKGGAGKVYFVLYLAVILELLIIFIERDEAEEGLRRQQQQALEIVQTILSQLTTGSGATGITAQPKDNITLSEKDPESNVRNYDVAVAVGDPKVSFQAEGRTVNGDDVARLQYTVSHIGNPEVPEEELGPDDQDITGGSKIFEAELGTLVGGYRNPRQTFGGSVPAENSDTYFMLNEEKTNDQLSRGRRIKVFSVNFKPNQGAGWYRLRFFSQTNKILGVAAEPRNDDTVRIGNIKLAVKQLRQVQKVLKRSRTGDTATANKVLSYIETLLTPNAYLNLDENKGFTSFNVRVVKPELPPPGAPVAQFLVQGDTLYWYEGAPLKVKARLGPEEGSKSIQGVSSYPKIADGLYEATLQNPQSTEGGYTSLIARASNSAGRSEQDELFVRVEKPTWDGGVKGFQKWRAMRATIGNRYDPSSDWESRVIRPDQYQTVVSFNGNEVFEAPGTDFKVMTDDQRKRLTVTEGTNKIVTTVYWKPNGTPDRTEWVAIATTDPSQNVVTQWKGDGVKISYPAPMQATGFDCEWTLSPRTLQGFSCPEQIRVVQRIGDRELPPTSVNALPSEEMAEYGITPRLKMIDDFTYSLTLEGDPKKIGPKIRELNGKTFDVQLEVKGKGGAVGSGGVRVLVRIG